MKHCRLFARIVLFALAAAATTAAIPGPLMERFAERRAERQAKPQADPQSDGSELESAGTGSAKFDLPPGARLMADVSYGADPLQRMDIYLPAQTMTSTLPAPVIFMVHGGAWRTGDKTGRGVAHNKVMRWLPKGFIVISANYPLLPSADPLQQADHVARALASAQAAAPTWGGDPARFVLMGHSAGAHLVALLNAAPARATALGAKPWLGTVSLDSAVMDVSPVMQARHLPFYDKAFGADPAFWRATSPLQMLVPGAPPMMGVCSSRRKDKPCAAAERLAGRAATLNVRMEVLPQDLTHGQINDQLGLPGAYTDGVERFMASLDAGVAARLAAR